MAPGKEVCMGCEEFRPLLQRFRAWKDDPDTKHDDRPQWVRPLSRDEALAMIRFMKHWPTNPHMAPGHVVFLVKAQEDIEALRGVTLSFITLGAKLTSSFVSRQNKRSFEAGKSHQSPSESPSTDTPRSENPTPVSEPDSVIITFATATGTVSPTPELPVAAENSTKSQPEVIDISYSPEVPPCEGETSKDSGSSLPSGSLHPSSSDQQSVDFLSTWNPKEIEEFCWMYYRVFLPNYPLYMAARYFMPRDEQRLRNDQIHHPYMTENFVFWMVQCQGLAQISNFFANATFENTDLSEACLLVYLSYHVRHFAYSDHFVHAIAAYRIHVINYLLSLPLEEFRKMSCKHIAESMWSMRKDTPLVHSTFDLEGLNLAHRFFSCSSHLQLRLVGIQEINTCISVFHDTLSDMDPRVAAQLGNHMAEWILDRRVVEEIFGQNAHVELISRSARIIDFLSTHQRLSIAQLDCMWNAAQMNYISRQVFEMLPSITRSLEPPLLIHLYEKLQEMEPASHTEHSINVASAAIKTIWSYAINQKPPFGSPPKRSIMNYTLPEKSSYQVNSGRSSSEASSSGSGSDDDSNSDDYESDNHEGTSGVSKIPNIATLATLYPSRGTDQGPHRTLSTLYPARGADSVTQRLNPKVLGLRLAQVMTGVAGTSKVIQVTQIESSEDGSDESAPDDGDEEEDEEDDEEEDDDGGGDDEPSTASSGGGKRPVRTPQRLPLTPVKPKRTPAQPREPATSPVNTMLRKPSLTNITWPINQESTAAIVELLGAATASTSNGDSSRVTIVPDSIVLAQIQNRAIFAQMAARGSAMAVTPCRNNGGGGNVMMDIDGDEDVLIHHTQGSDCAEVEVNSSTSDMSEKEKDLDNDLSDANLAAETAFMEDDMDESMDMSFSDISSKQLSSFLSRNSSDVLKIKQLTALSQKCRQNYQENWKAKDINYNLEDVAKPGMTLLWDFIQNNSPVSVNPAAFCSAERELTNLILTMNNTRLASRFAEACDDNVRQHRAVAVSLRLLPKLMQNFGCNRTIEFVQKVAADFFADLAVFSEYPPDNEQQKQMDIRVRLSFLQLLYSNLLPEKKIRLTKTQLDTLWTCFVVKLSAQDELCSWLMLQLTVTDNHALTPTVTYHLFYNHLGLIEATAMTQTAFKLYQQCLNYLVQSDATDAPKQQPPTTCLKSECADRVWIYAMFGETDVSELAIRHLNNFYIHAVKTTKDNVVNYKEQELYKRSMDYIVQAMPLLDVNLSSFTTLLRGFTLMRKQIETYRQRYGFHLRLWQLAGCGVLSHNFHYGMVTNNLRSFCFFRAGFAGEEGRNQEITATLAPGQFLGELKAELAFGIWRFFEKHPVDPKSPRGYLDELYNFIESRGPMYIVHQHRQIEYGPEHDEQNLHELGFRQENSIFVTFGASLRKPLVVKPKDKSVSIISPPPVRDCVPMVIAASPQNFEIFFELQRRLDLLAPSSSAMDISDMQLAEVEGEQLRKQLSRYLWEFLMLIPTSEEVSAQLRLQPPRDQPTPEEWKEILPADNPHRLLYALQALENLIRDPNAHGPGVVNMDIPHAWADQLIAKGGFDRLYELLMLKPMQDSGGTSDGVDHQRDCLSTLIRVVYLFSLERGKVKSDEDSEVSEEESSDDEVVLGNDVNTAVANKKRKGSDKQESSKATNKRARHEMNLREGPRFRHSILQILDTNDVLTALLRIQYNSVLPAHGAETQKMNRSARMSRTLLMRLGFDFLHGWATCNQLVFPALSRHPFLAEWLRRLVLESVDSGITLETCLFIERMCRLEPEYELGCALLSPLVALMPVAENVKCLRSAMREDKNPLRPSPRFFYESISKLLEIIPGKYVVEKVDLDSLCEQLANSLENRPIHEPRSGSMEDDGLIGLLKVASQVLSHNPAFKFKPAGMKMLLTVYSCLFDLPSPKNRELPKCKSAASRFAAYLCLTEMSKSAAENFTTLVRLLLKDELSRQCCLWDYWPRDDTRPDCGYVGIMNLGATCYMATTMQHLYMIPEARKAVFEAVPSANSDRDDWAPTALHEMQRMFAFLLESERKAYSPEAFCRVYEMNNQTLNPTEQKDMMEFFSDLVSKMEEMSPSSKHIFKRLFTGTTCNTVVSLDCGHVSQTTEDFTTVRCQVNNMHNLYESLNDVCVKDVLEGNNMYKCSQCDREVRAEKQTCFRSLPEILVLNTMRYSFNMVSMQREKVNTHFSFPNVLEMASYMEENLVKKDGDVPMGNTDKYKYELIGVTVHTGTADGGHYYSFIRDLEHGDEDRWYLFNDAEVRVFDPEQLADECFGGEAAVPPKQQFDHPGDRYLDFGLEKTNSAYMLFYERAEKVREQLAASKSPQPVTIPKDLQKWVFDDTVSFVRDTIVFDRHYFDFIWRLCLAIPPTITNKDQADCVVVSGELGLSFVWETLIHSRDRTLLNNFSEMTSKWGQPLHFTIAEWFFRQMMDDNHKDNRWLYNILVLCPIGTVRYTFQRYIISLITKLRHPVSYLGLYLQETAGYSLTFLIGKFCRQCISLLGDTDVRMHWRHLSDMMHFLLEFARLGVVEAYFLLCHCQLLSQCYHFYNYVRRLKDVRSSLIGPLFPNFLEMAMLGTIDDRDSSDRFSPDLDKDKPNTLSLMVTLLRSCVEDFQESVFNCKQIHTSLSRTVCGAESMPTHSDIEEFLVPMSLQELLEFICNLFRDGVEPIQAPRLTAMLFFDKPDKVRTAIIYVVQKIADLSVTQLEGSSLLNKKERDREVQIKAYLSALAEMTRAGMACTVRLMGESVLDSAPEVREELQENDVAFFADYLLEQVGSLLRICPMLTLQWISEQMRSLDPLRQWTLDQLDLILDMHGVSLEKPPSPQREDLQLEVARLIIGLPGEARIRDVFCSMPGGILISAAKEKHATAVTVIDKVEVHLSTEQNTLVESLIAKVLSYLSERLQAKYPIILDRSVSTESYQWILFAVQFLLIDERKKRIVLDNYRGLQQLLLAQMQPTAKHGGNRQGLLQLFTVASLRYPAMADRLISDTELMDCLLTDTEIRANDDAVIMDREGRYTGAVLLLLNALCVTNGAFAAKMAEDPRLIAKIKKAMHLKVFDICRRPLVAVIGTLISEAPYPEGRAMGEVFRRAMFDLIVAIRVQWPTSTMIASQIVRKIIEGADEDFQTYVVENRLMEMLTEYFRTYTISVNKALTYMYDEANWSMMTLRKLRGFAVSRSDTNARIREALTNWQVYAKQISREMSVDIVTVVEGTGPIEFGGSRSVVTTPRRRN